MNPLFIGLGLIAFSNLYGPLLKMLHIKPSDNNAVAYSLFGILCAGIAVHFTDTQINQGSVIVLILCAIGSIVRIGYTCYQSNKAGE
jgi:hypothetical protein